MTRLDDISPDNLLDIDEDFLEIIEDEAQRLHSPALHKGNGWDKAAYADSGFHLTDLGNAKRLVARHGKKLRYCFPRKKWLVFEGNRWAWDDTGEVLRLGKDTVAAIYQEAAEAALGRPIHFFFGKQIV